jgi:hypothetical protein
MSARTSRKGNSKYKVTNSAEYEASLISRSSISVWLDEDAIDHDALRKALNSKEIKEVFPPQHNTVLSNTATDNPTQRDKDIMRINKNGRDIWKYFMYRFKEIIG